MTYFLEMHPGVTLNEILECALRHGVFRGNGHSLLGGELIGQSRDDSTLQFRQRQFPDYALYPCGGGLEIIREAYGVLHRNKVNF